MKRDEQTIQYRKKLDKLEQQFSENKARQKKSADDAKILRRKKATAERNMRTHRLCVLGALLKKQLKEPDLLRPPFFLYAIPFAAKLHWQGRYCITDPSGSP